MSTYGARKGDHAIEHLSRCNHSFSVQITFMNHHFLGFEYFLYRDFHAQICPNKSTNLYLMLKFDYLLERP